MGLFERNNIDVEVKNPMEIFFVQYFAVQRSDEETQAFETLIREKEVVMRLLWRDEMTGNFGYDDEETDDEEDMSEEEMEMDGGM